MIGQSIAHYTITAKLGQGGMGEVWRATDTKLNRDVALKIIPEIFSSDSQRMARFTREAQLLASLNHANIAAIYGVEEFDGRRCLVLELVEGQDLHERIKAGPIPLDDALEIARQIAEALEAAHEKGVVHRDLKPANVKLTAGGEVKVLDFGLAKALEGDPGSMSGDPGQSLSPTLTQAATQAGVILGTAAYMSPEQAKGKPVDRRADIFSYGVVLFEILARRQCFAGETISETLASVMKDEPDWSQLPDDMPPVVESLVRRCLEKDPKLRLRDIGEARITLAAVKRGEIGTSMLATMAGTTAAGASSESTAGVAGESAAGTTPAPVRRGPRPLIWLILMAVIAAVAATAGFEEGKQQAPPVPPRQFAVAHEGLKARFGRAPAISPDGRRIAYVADERIWLRDLDSLKPREVPESRGAQTPFWSPDSGWLAWVAGDKLYKMPVGGGQPVVLSKVENQSVHGGAWGEDGSIYLTGTRTDIRVVSDIGGEPRAHLEAGQGEVVDFHSNSVLPGGRGIIYTVHGKEGPESVEVFADGERKEILRYPGERVESAVYDSSGYLLLTRLVRNEGLWAMPFSLDDLEVTGEPFLLDPEGGWASVSREGTLLYVQGAGTTSAQLVFVDRTGQVVETLSRPQLGMENPELSWDASHVLVSAEEGGNRDIWMHDLQRGSPSRMTFDETIETSPAWLPGGDRIAYSSGRGANNSALVARAADGTGEVQILAEKGVFPSFRPGQSLFAFSASRGEEGWDIWYGTLGPDGGVAAAPEKFLGGLGHQYDIQLSPDGELIAYANRDSGREEIFLMEFPGKGGKWQVSIDGGFWPRWSRRGDELYFLRENPGGYSLMAVKVQRSPGIRLSPPEELFHDQSSPGLILDSSERPYDVHPDGKRFLVTQVPEGERAIQTYLVVSQNWVEAFRGEER